jgi:RND superfamily putative drug exporter
MQMRPLTNFVIARSKLSLFGFIGLILLSLIGGVQAFGNLSGGGSNDPGSDSAKVADILVTDFNLNEPEVVLIADMGRSVDDPESAEVADRVTYALEQVEGVDSVSSYYSLGSPATLRSTDGEATYFFVELDPNVSMTEVSGVIQDQFTGDNYGATLYVVGVGAVTSEINHTIETDLVKAESIALPLIMLLMIFVFGSVVAAGLPLMIAVLTILGSFFFVWISSLLTETSTFSVNLITGLGLGLGIDYALLMVNRYREQRQQKQEVSKAVEVTMMTAGRTVFFSGLTVALVMVALNFFPQTFLKSFAMAGLVSVSLAVAAALIALPALLNLLGDNLERWPLFKHRPAKDVGFWSKLAVFVMKRPVAIIVVAVISLGSLASLGTGIKLGLVDDRILPPDNRVVVATDQIRERFSGREGSPVEIMVKSSSEEQITSFAKKLSNQEDIVRVQTSEGVFTKIEMPDGSMSDGMLVPGTETLFTDYQGDTWTRIVVIADVEPRSPAGEELTLSLREQSNGFSEILIGGSAASYTDSLLGITNNLPWAVLWIVVATLILLFLFTGSLLLPIKAVLLNFLSLFATLGFLVWVFMDGNLKWLLGDFATPGTIDSSSIVLVAVIAFGLSMDYELFLLSRIKEQHDQGLNTTDSVALGLQRSGRIITTAALVLAFSFIVFATSGVSIMKMLGLGIAFAVLLDATVIRALLVPALMRLFGKANWYAPKWMLWIQKKVGLEH